MELKPSTYNFIGDDKPRMGLIAQDVQDAVSKHGLPDPTESVANTICLDYNALIPMLIKTVQSQQKRIEALEAQINGLLGN